MAATGCLKRIGASILRSSVVRIAALALLTALAEVSAAAQISPGALAKPHSFLSGAANCTSCHRLGGGKPVFLCLECHTEIGRRIGAGRGFHARVVAKSAGSQTCATCHSDHNGEQFALIRWEPSQQRFDHTRTGWTLTGKHAELPCQRCHTRANISADDKPLIGTRDLSRTWLLASRDCITCHNDPHRGQLGRTCDQCHSTSDWKTVPGFDHARTRFALTGAHSKVACEKCHTPAGGAPRWTGLPFGRCTDCHADPHRGSFAAPCQSCHNTTAWKSLAPTVVAAKFDHSKTQYPLLGKHASVRCEQCHAGADFKKPIAFQKCSDCHHPDPHSGQFAKRADAGECSACHSVEGFKPAKFGLAEHAKTAYPLQGKHATVACERCHIPAGTATLYRIKFGQCTDCHRDTHGGQFATAPYLNRCEACHSVQGFRPSSFTLANHNRSRFPLTGSHEAVMCSDCHKPMGGPELSQVVRYRFDDRSCSACHQDPHRGEFTARMSVAGADGQPAGCQACHSLTSWKELSRFDHGSTRFALTGAHRAVACIDCHRPPNLETTLARVDFHAASSRCEDCHKDIHGGQFAAAGQKTLCAGCHETSKWKPSLFDHAKTRFPLEGVHKNVRCAGCHRDVRQVNGAEVLFYKPTPTECAACHGANVPSSAAARNRP